MMRTGPNYLAIYFNMGHYNEDDGNPELVGFDCPSDDSIVLNAGDEEELERLIQEVYDASASAEVYDENSPSDFEGCHPDIIVDSKGEIQIDIYRRLCSDTGFDPDLIRYSHGRETLDEFWSREKWRWIENR